MSRASPTNPVLRTRRHRLRESQNTMVDPKPLLLAFRNKPNLASLSRSVLQQDARYISGEFTGKLLNQSGIWRWVANLVLCTSPFKHAPLLRSRTELSPYREISPRCSQQHIPVRVGQRQCEAELPREEPTLFGNSSSPGMPTVTVSDPR